MGAHKRPGRPTKLTPALADGFVQLVAAGSTVTEAAAAVGVARRTINNWRSRAWSRRLQDQPYVAFERDVLTAIAIAADRASALEPWEVVAARLEQTHPERRTIDTG